MKRLVLLSATVLAGLVLALAGQLAGQNATPFLTLLSRDVSVGNGDTLDGVMPLQLGDDADADGRFEIVGVPPGSFTLRAQARRQILVPFDTVNQRFVAPQDVPPIEMAVIPVNVDGDVGGLTLTTSPGGNVEIVLVPDQGAELHRRPVPPWVDTACASAEGATATSGSPRSPPRAPSC